MMRAHALWVVSGGFAWRRIATAIRAMPKMVATVAMKSCILTLGFFMFDRFAERPLRCLTALLFIAGGDACVPGQRSNF